jgi:hypothetical protein
METITLQRTGDRPLQFSGEELAGASSHRHDGACNTRWHELTLYRTEAGQYVLHVGYRTRWQGEHDHDAVFTHATPEGVVEEIRSTLPTEHLVGFPPGAQYAGKQARIEHAIGAGYLAAATQVLAALGPEKL